MTTPPKTPLEQMMERVATLTAERDEADRRAGAAERRESLALTLNRNREEWLAEAKLRAGHHPDAVSFDAVFEELLKETLEARAMRADFAAPLMTFYEVTTVRQLIEAQAAHIVKLQQAMPAYRDPFHGSPRQG